MRCHDEIRARVALHKRKHIPFLLHARPDSVRELRVSTRVSKSDRNWNLYDRHDSAREKGAEMSLRLVPFRRFFSIVSVLSMACCCRMRCNKRAVQRYNSSLNKNLFNLYLYLILIKEETSPST